MSTADIAKLREETGAGVMDVKRVLDEAKGDFGRAKELLKERGLEKVAKREGRETGAGRIESYIHQARVGVLLELRSETDFVANSEPLVDLAHNLALQLVAIPAETEEEFLSSPFIKDESKTVKDLINEVIAKVGENVTLGKFYRLAL